MARVPTQGIDYTSKDYEAFRAMMIKELSVKMPEYTDTRQSDAGIVILELNAQGLDIISYYQDAIANEAFLTTEEQRNNALKWCQMLSYTPRNATPARLKQVFVLSAAQTTNTTIPAGTVVKTLNSSAESEILFETTEDLVIPAGKLGNEQTVPGTYDYTVDIVQGTSISGELLGSSNGTANQSFMLNYTPVIVDSINVIINEGSGFESWTKVDNFVDSDSTSKHYTVSINDNDEATITFGDGVFGKIPSPYTNGIYCDYRIGGGEQGNVGANKVIVLETNLALVSSTFNPDLPYENGQDKESLEEIKINAPIANRTLWGALTLEDFAGVVELNFPDVQYATSKRDPENADNIYIYVYLRDEQVLTQDIKDEILSIFDENDGGRKIVGADQIFIEYATFVPLTLTANLVVKDRYNQDTVENNITTYLENYFKKGNYPFDTELSLTELAANVMNPENAIDGIKSFKFTSPETDVLTPEVGQIYTLNSISYTTTGGIA